MNMKGADGIRRLASSSMRVVVCSATLFSTVLWGCGDSADSGCRSAAPCGGDPTGTWQSTSFCSDVDPTTVAEDAGGLPPECAGAFNIDSITPTTVLTLSADQTYSESGSLELDWTFRFSSACMSALAGQPLTSADAVVFCNAFQSQSESDPTSPFINMTCRASGGTCQCEAQQSEPIETVGSFQIQDQSLLFEDGRNAQFCVNGDELSLRLDDAELGVGSVSYTRAAP